jgi:hypothetical protein
VTSGQEAEHSIVALSDYLASQQSDLLSIGPVSVRLISKYGSKNRLHSISDMIRKSPFLNLSWID